MDKLHNLNTESPTSSEYITATEFMDALRIGRSKFDELRHQNLIKTLEKGRKIYLPSSEIKRFLKIILSNKAMNNPQFSFFKGGITQTKLTRSIDIDAVYKMIISDNYKSKIEKIRAEKDLEDQRKLKSRFDYVCFSSSNKT